MASAIVPEKLRYGNYDSWSACMKNYLLANDLWDLIESPSGTEPPNQEVAEAEYKAWRKKNATALLAIQISCMPNIILKTELSTDSAKIAWDNLANYFRKPLAVSKGNAVSIPTSESSDTDSDFSDTESVSSEKKIEPLASSQHNGAGMVKDDYTRFAGLIHSVYKGDWHSTRNFLDRHPGVINAKIDSFGHTVLHIATIAENVKIGGKLVELMSKEALARQDGNGNTALHYAAYRGTAKMARYIVEKNDTVVAIANKGKRIPIACACLKGRRDVTIYLLSVTPFEVLSLENGFHGCLLPDTIVSKMLDVALEIFRRCSTFTTATDATGAVYYRNTLSALLVASRDLFPSGCQLGFWQRLIYSCMHARAPLITGKGVDAHILDQSQHDLKNIMQQVLGKWSRPFINFLEFSGILKIYELKMTHAYSSRLLNCLCEHMSTLDDSTFYQIGVFGVFMKAVELGSVEIILEMVELSASLPYNCDRNGRDAVMSSIVYRQEKVFNLFYGLARHHSFVDNLGNTMLHLAGKLCPSIQLLGNTTLHLPGMLCHSTQPSRISGAALQMQRELQWYKEVESIVDPAAKFTRNNIGETPRQVFSKSHKQLVIEGEKWTKNTATCHALAGAFIIIIMFAAAFTVPGGNIQEIGIPVIFHEKAFLTFIISDSISLCASTTSVLTFLEIHTAGYAEEDFLISLPRKLIIGLSTLIISIAAMMVAFCAALTVMLDGRMELIVPIVLLACVPVTLFMFSEFPLLAEIFMSTYGPSIFKRKKKPRY